MGAGEGALAPHCVVTRIEFKRLREYWYGLLLFYRLRRIGMVRIPGVLMSTVSRHRRERRLIFVSVWPSQYELLAFTSLEEHVQAVRWSLGVGATVWSGVFQLLGQSSTSTDWLGAQPPWRPAIVDWSNLRPQAEHDDGSRAP